MREGWRGTRTCFLLFIREETKERRIFLDFTSRTSKYVCVSHRDRKGDCKRVCVKDVFPHLYTWCPKISTFGMCFHKNMGTRMCILMNTKMARELVCVSSPHHHRAWKRVCVKNVFFLCFLKTEIRSCCLSLKHTRTVVFARNSSNFEIKS